MKTWYFSVGPMKKVASVAGSNPCVRLTDLQFGELQLGDSCSGKI